MPYMEGGLGTVYPFERTNVGFQSQPPRPPNASPRCRLGTSPPTDLWGLGHQPSTCVLQHRYGSQICNLWCPTGWASGVQYSNIQKTLSATNAACSLPPSTFSNISRLLMPHHPWTTSNNFPPFLPLQLCATSPPGPYPFNGEALALVHGQHPPLSCSSSMAHSWPYANEEGEEVRLICVERAHDAALQVPTQGATFPHVLCPILFHAFWQPHPTWGRLQATCRHPSDTDSIISHFIPLLAEKLFWQIMAYGIWAHWLDYIYYYAISTWAHDWDFIWFHS